MHNQRRADPAFVNPVLVFAKRRVAHVGPISTIRNERIRRAAKGMNQPLEKALVNIVRAAIPSLEKVPAEYRADLEAMEDLGDEELWRITQRRLAPAKQRRLERLLGKNQQGELTDPQRRVLGSLRAEGDRLMLRRAYAYLLLKYRGHRIPNLGDLPR